RRNAHQISTCREPSFRPQLEALEDRKVLSTFFVAPTGTNSAATTGTIDNPFQSIQYALDHAATHPGDKVLVRSGVYREKITFSHGGTAKGGFITLAANPGENPVIDGTGLPPREDTRFGDNLVLIHNVSYVTLQGFEIANASGLTDANDGSGVRVEGYGTHIRIIKNTIHDIHGSGGAMGITIYGTSLTQPLSTVIISGNQVYRCDPGASEALTLNGNVIGFRVINNTVHDVGNIGIDMVGGEYAIFGLPGPRANLPVAREGVCAGNTVYNARSSDPVNNPAAGIYVDGGRNIKVGMNRCYQNDLGIEIGAENPGYVASGVLVRNNLLYANRNAGLAFGGYAKSVGRVQKCLFINNTLDGNDTADTGNGQLWIQWASGNVVTNNILFASANNVLVSSLDAGSNTGNVLDYNLYYATSKPTNPDFAQFTWNAKAFNSFTLYRKATSNDTHSLFGKDPLFRDAATGDFQLLAYSPAIDKGSAAPGLFAPLDFVGATRDKRPDIGAFEHRLP
ncbi:MAG: choice-of-anchor Q domain-containing protein, partial [Gemmataceae bacterium]